MSAQQGGESGVIIMYTVRLSGVTVPTNVGTWQAKTLLGAKRLATKMAIEYGVYNNPCDAVYINDEYGCTVAYKLHGCWINI